MNTSSERKQKEWFSGKMNENLGYIICELRDYRITISSKIDIMQVITKLLSLKQDFSDC
jgi:hypothetical protein